MPSCVTRLHRVFRFSLRSLLLLITVSAVWFGYEVNRGHRQKLSADAVRKLGGSVYFDYQFHNPGTVLNIPARTVKLGEVTVTYLPLTFTVKGERTYLIGVTVEHPVPSWIRKLVGDEMFVTAWAVHFDNTTLTDDDIECLDGFPELRVLRLSSTRITDDALARLSRLRNLEELWLNQTAIEGHGLAHLENLQKLEELYLHGTNITDNAIIELSAPKNLRTLTLDDTDVGDAGLSYLQYARQLETLSLSGTNVSGKGFDSLTAMSQLKELRLAYTPVKEDAGILRLAELPQLRQLSLEHSLLSDVGLGYLSELKRLKELRLPWVGHRSTNISVEAARSIEKALPNTEVTYPP